jgi:hypothetical protein
VLEAIGSGSITGQSFSGRFVQSTPSVPRGGFKPDARSGELTLVTRTEIAMREYGPTPFPAYSDAAIVGVRSLVDQIEDLDDDALLALARRLNLATPLEPAQGTDTPVVGAVAEAPQSHAGRSLNARVRAGMIARGITL